MNKNEFVLICTIEILIIVQNKYQIFQNMRFCWLGPTSLIEVSFTAIVKTHLIPEETMC